MKHDWEYKKLGEVASYINGFAFKPEQWTTEGVPIIRIQNLNNPDAPFNHYDGAVPEKVKVANGDLLISWSATLGTYIWEGGDAYLNQHIFKVEFDKGEIDKMYLKYAVSSKLDAMANLVHGATMKHIVKKDFDNTRIPVPSLPVQKQICSLLDKLSLIIEKKKEQVKQLDILAQSIFYDMFGDPVENEKGWEVKTFNEVFAITTGKLNANAMVPNGQYPFFTCSKEVFNIDKYAFDQEALLLSGNNATANYDVKYYNGKFNAYQRTYVLTSKGSNYRYLQSALEEKLSLLQEQSIGGMTKYLTLGILEKLRFFIPPLSMQQSFSVKMKAIERQKELINQSITEVQTLFDSQMECYFGE